MIAWTAAGMQLAAVTIDAGWVIGGLIVFFIGQALLGIITARVTGARQGVQITALFKSQDANASQLHGITETLERHTQSIVGIDKARLQCRNECVDKTEYVRMVGTFTTSERAIHLCLDAMRSEIGAKVDHVHDRITDVARQVSHIQGAQDVRLDNEKGGS